jgi:hypothetical protein
VRRPCKVSFHLSFTRLIRIFSSPPIRGHAGRQRLKSKPSIFAGKMGNRHTIAGKFAGLEREIAQ